MASFEYNGYNQSGKTVVGTIEAGSERVAFDQLVGTGITPIELKLREAGGHALDKSGGGTMAKLLPGRVPAARRTTFVAQMATLVQADTPLLEALKVLEREEKHPYFREILEDLEQRVQKGDSFSAALAQYPRVFPTVLVTMVQVGEKGGQLGEVLERMAEWMEHEQDVKAEVRSAMVYPCIVLILFFISVLILMLFVLPRFEVVFQGREDILPWSTKFLLGSSKFLQHWWWTLLLGIPLVVGGLYYAFHSAPVRRGFDRILLRIPIFGPLALQSQLARFAAASASLLAVGVTLLETLQVGRGLLTNSQVRELIDNTIEKVIRGQGLARSLGESSWFPAPVVHLLAVGERTGRLGDMFDRVAKQFEKATRLKIRTMVDLLSPAMIVILTLGIMFVAVSILIPVYRMNNMMN